jgi:membrane-associated phospholipid phosphatase
MFPLFYRFIPNFLKIFSGRNLLFHLSAIILTFVIVTTDFDWKYFLYFHHSTVQHLLFPAVWIGFFVPVLVPVILLLLGLLLKNFLIRNIGWALGQAAFTGWLVASCYKAFTGRPGPRFHGHDALLDTSRVFRFGFWRGGIFWGWPSSHTTVACAMAFTLFFMFRGNKWIRYLMPLYALFIGAGVSMSIHWFSDFVAGAIFGFVIGSVVGKSFSLRKEKWAAQKREV